MDTDCLTEISEILIPSKHGEHSKAKCEIVPLHGSKPHAFLMDCTHDNESPADKRTARDALSTGGLVPFAFSAIGSNKGFDDLYPKLLNLVCEKRLYDHVKVEAGIGRWKRLLNHLHAEMAADGFKEGHFHQENDVSSSSAGDITKQIYSSDSFLCSTLWPTGCIHPRMKDI
jgi:glycogen debranching enzyme